MSARPNSKYRKHYLIRAKKISGDKCFYCEKEEATTLDHFIPRNKSGTNNVWNMVPCCDFCNQKKGSKIYIHFIAKWIKLFSPPKELIQKIDWFRL